MDYQQKWTEVASDLLLNRKIVKVRYMEQSEADDMGWYSRPVAFLLDNGIWVFPSADDEGNNGGSLFTTDSNNSVLPVL